MNNEIFNSIYKYVEVLYDNNKRLIKVFGVDAIDAINSGTKDILNIIQDIPRLVPYAYCKKNNQWIIDSKYGLMEYKDVISYLLNENEKILNNNFDCLIKIKKIRNKYEHIVHNIRLISCYTGNDANFQYSFKIKDNEIILNSKEMVSLFKELNIFYDRLIKDILKYAYDNNLNSNFFNRLMKINLLNFNKIYDSDLIYEIGKLFNND